MSANTQLVPYASELQNKIKPRNRELLDSAGIGLRGSLSQDDIAEILRVTQNYISKLERQDDMLLSRLYAYVEALGGELEIRAKFPNKEVRINQYREVDKLRAALAPSKKHKESA